MCIGDDWTVFRISLRVQADRIDVAQLERLLGLSHSSFLPKQSRLIDAIPATTRDTWVYRVGKGRLDQLDGALLRLGELLRQQRSELREVSEGLGYRVECYISYHSSLLQGGFELSHDLLQALGDARVRMRISIMAWGGVAHAGDRGGQDPGNA